MTDCTFVQERGMPYFVSREYTTPGLQEVTRGSYIDVEVRNIKLKSPAGIVSMPGKEEDKRRRLGES